MTAPFWSARAAAAIERAQRLSEAAVFGRTARCRERARGAVLRQLRLLPWIAPETPIRPPSLKPAPAGWRRAATRPCARRVFAEAAPEEQQPWASATVLACRSIARTTKESDEPGWVVRELDTRKVPGHHAESCLVFENHVLVRRLWSYPTAWASMDDAALLRLVGLRPTAD